MKDEIVQEGEDSFFADRSKLRNPYPVGSDEYNRFERGWVQAFKKSEAGLLSSPVQSKAEYPIRPIPSKSPNTDQLDKAAADYKARKG